jgi:transposase
VALFVARQLRALGLTPVVVDAHEVRRKAHRPRQKSDGRDAHEWGEGLRRGLYRSLVPIPPVPLSVRRETLAQRRHFVRVQTAESTAANHGVRAVGLGHLSRNRRTATGWAARGAALEAPPALPRAIGPPQLLWQQARTEGLALEQLLAEPQQPFAAELQRLQTIAGGGPIGARTVVAVFSEVERFRSAKPGASSAGLVPSTSPSGERARHGRLTKPGAGELGALRCEAAQPARRSDHPLTPYFTNLRAKRGYRLAVIAVVHRLCRSMFARLGHPTDFAIQHLGIEEGPVTRTTVRRYRLSAP